MPRSTSRPLDRLVSHFTLTPLAEAERDLAVVRAIVGARKGAGGEGASRRRRSPAATVPEQVTAVGAKLNKIVESIKAQTPQRRRQSMADQVESPLLANLSGKAYETATAPLVAPQTPRRRRGRPSKEPAPAAHPPLPDQALVDEPDAAIGD